MPRIPQYFHQSQPSQPVNVRVDTNLLSPQYAAGQRVGAAVAQTGDQMVDLSFQLQKAQNFKTSSALQMAMDEEWDNFQTTLNPATDETKWTEEWQKKLDARVSKMLPKAAGPLFREQLETTVNQYKVRSSSEVAQQAKAAGVEKAKITGMTRTNQLWRNGDAAGAEANLREMASLGLILSEEIPGMVQKGVSRMEAQQATNLINNDPIAASEALSEKTETGRWKNFKQLDEDERLTLQNHARTRTTAMQSEAYQGMIDGLSNGEVLPPEVLQEMVDSKVIKASQRKTYEAAYRHGTFNTDPEAIGSLFTELNKYDPQNDPHQTERAKLLGKIATSGFPTNVQSEANQLLGKKSDPLNPLNSAVAKDAFQAIDQRFGLGIYGKYESRYFDPSSGQWTTKVDAKVYEEAMIKKRRVEDATRKFITDNPKATAEQVNQFVGQVQLSDTVKTGRQMILGDAVVIPDATRANETAAAKAARLDAILNK